MVEGLNEITNASSQPANLDDLISKLKCLFKLLSFHANRIFSLTDNYIEEVDKINQVFDSHYYPQYLGVIESCSLYKKLVVDAKLLLSDDLVLFASVDSGIVEIADKYKYELVIQVAHDHHHAQAKAQQLSEFIKLSTEHNFLMTRWRRELIELIEMCFE